MNDRFTIDRKFERLPRHITQALRRAAATVQKQAVTPGSRLRRGSCLGLISIASTFSGLAVYEVNGADSWAAAMLAFNTAANGPLTFIGLSELFRNRTKS